jgi:iron complex transport system substrate-binding protein
MEKKNIAIIVAVVLVLILCVAGYSVYASSAQPTVPVQKTKTITDMMGRNVTIPSPVQKVVTIGSVPVQNSFIFALGKNGTIANGLPDSFIKQGRWKYQYVFARNLKGEPGMQSSTYEPNIEEIIKAGPEVVFTMDQATVNTLDKSGINVVYLSWVDAEDVKKLMTLMGDIYDRKDAAQEYVQFFDTTIQRVDARVAQIPADQRPKVLYFQYSSLTVPHKIGDWWITKAGGKSVTDAPRQTETLKIEPEQILRWNPDIMIVATPSEIDAVYNDTRLSTVNAVRNKRVYITPMGAHIWSHRGIETPLTVLWAAKLFYPEKFADLDLEQETTAFYQKFFGYTLVPEQVKEILSGKAKI